MPTATTLADLPEKTICRKCGQEKPRDDMLVVRHRKTKAYFLRPRCKGCHNAMERGHRRQYKTDYLRKWRSQNPELARSYRQQNNEEKKAQLAAKARKRFTQKHHAILIQGRMNRRGMNISITEAEKFLKTYGPAFPSRQGLTAEGLRECERIRSTYRRERWPVDAFKIRLMVYEDGLFIKPSRQKPPYRKASMRLKKWWENKKKGGIAQLPISHSNYIQPCQRNSAQRRQNDNITSPDRIHRTV